MKKIKKFIELNDQIKQQKLLKNNLDRYKLSFNLIISFKSNYKITKSKSK